MFCSDKAPQSVAVTQLDIVSLACPALLEVGTTLPCLSPLLCHHFSHRHGIGQVELMALVFDGIVLITLLTDSQHTYKKETLRPTYDGAGSVDNGITLQMLHDQVIV